MRNMSQQSVSWPRFEPGVSRIQITIKSARYIALMTLPWKHVGFKHLHRWHLDAQNCTPEDQRCNLMHCIHAEKEKIKLGKI
jgi:hypothetical protein